jgi:predicted metal-dependent hydrolase
MKLDYTIIYSKRKTINILVDRDRQVVVRAPQGTDPQRIQKTVESKKFWLYEKLNHRQKYPPVKRAKELVSGESLMYLGRNYRLELVSEGPAKVVFDQKFIIPRSPRPTASSRLIQWYMQKARQRIHSRACYYAKHLGVSFNEIIISDLRFRWGSCTKKQNLNFNWRLIKAPMRVIDYVVVHELTHLLEPNHNPNFWNIVSIQVPHYQKAKQWLLEHGHLLEEEL